MFKEVVFLVSCMENDERIIMELEARSRRPLWGKGIYEAGWLVVKSGHEGHSGDGLAFPCHRVPWAAILWKMELKALLGSRLRPISQVSSS